MKILIVGCGYVGSAVAELLHPHHELTVTTRKSVPYKTVPWNADALKDQEVVIVTVAPDKREDYASTYLGTAQIILQNLPSKQLIYTSSTSVYGDHQGDWVDENTPTSPLNPSAQILVDTEELYLTFPGSCILRLGEIYGPGRELEQRLQIIQGTTLPGTGKNYVNRSPLSLITTRIIQAVNENWTGIYNVVEDEHPTRQELYDTVCKKEGFQFINWDPSKESFHGGNKRVSAKKQYQ